MDPQQATGLDSYFTYGFRVFAVVTVITTIVCAIVWLNVEKKSEDTMKTIPGMRRPSNSYLQPCALRFLSLGF